MPIDIVFGAWPETKPHCDYIEDLRKKLEKSCEIVRVRLKKVADVRKTAYGCKVKEKHFQPVPESIGLLYVQ